MLRVGLVSDTHGYFDEKIVHFFKEVDEIWHAGDIGSFDIINQLKKINTNVKVVYGNIDGGELRQEFQEHLIWEAEGFKIWMTHIGGYPNHYSPSVKRLLPTIKPDIFVCGHSHILRVMRDAKYNNMVVMNPGAAGVHGWHKVKTVLRFTLHEKKILNLEAIELGYRGKTEITD